MGIRRILLGHLSDTEKLKVISKVARMLIEQGKRDPDVNALAIKIVRDCEPKDYLCEVKALHKWVQNDKNIRYIKDTFGVEKFATVRRTLKQGAGDCDCKSIVLSALAESIGHETRLVLVDGNMQGKFTHVIPQIKVDDVWKYAEVTKPDVAFGWKPPMTKAYVITRTGDTMIENILNELKELGGIIT